LALTIKSDAKMLSYFYRLCELSVVGEGGCDIYMSSRNYKTCSTHISNWRNEGV